MTPKFNVNSVIKQTVKANSDAGSSGLFNWMKGGIKAGASGVDNMTGNRISQFMNENSVINGLKDTMSTKDIAKRSLRDVNPDQADGLAKGIIGAQSAYTQAGGAIDDRLGTAFTDQLNNLGNNKIEMDRSLLDMGKDYYGDGAKGFARAGITLGAYGAAAVGGRYATGGTLTTNNRGENDIAGIPFI